MRFDLNESEKKKLLSLFAQQEQNIDYLLYVRDLIWQKPTFDCGYFIGKNPHEKKVAFFDQLFKNRATECAFVKKNLVWDTDEMKVDYFIHNPYYQALKNIAFSENGWTLEHKTITAYSLFPYNEQYHYGANYYLKPSFGFFTKDYVYPTLSLYDQEWMSLNPHEIRTMEVPIAIAKGKVLTLGLGLGYFAYMVHLKEDVKEVHIVEIDLELIKAFEKHLLPLFPHPEKIHIHKADAFYFIKNIKDKDYDFIFSDLWHDVSDGLPLYVKLRNDLKDLKVTKCLYWIENSILTYLRILVIGVMKDEYYPIDNDYDQIQIHIKDVLTDVTIKNSYDIDSLLNIQSLINMIVDKK